MFGGQDFIAGYCGPDGQISQNVQEQEVIIGGQNFMAEYCGPDVQLSQDVQEQDSYVWWTGFHSRILWSWWTALTGCLGARQSCLVDMISQQDNVVPMDSSHRMSRSRIVMFGGQDFIAGYWGPDGQLSQDVQEQDSHVWWTGFHSRILGSRWTALTGCLGAGQSCMVDRISYQDKNCGPDVQLSQDVQEQDSHCLVERISQQDTEVLMYSSHKMSKSRIVMFGGQDFIAGY